ncbi:thrombospondin type 3 repeat-containing protein [Actinomadura fulvescens]
MFTPLAAAALTVALTAPGVAADEIRCGDWGCSNDQPRLTVPVPPPAPEGQYGNADFDRDGVLNKNDNCLLVPNRGQRKAVKPAGWKDGDVHQQAAEWKRQNPAAPFRTNEELGEACSGWNGNWRRTEMALVLAPEETKQQIYRFIGNGGPMYGKNTPVYGGPVCTDVNDGWVNMIEYALRMPEKDLPIADTPPFDCRTGAIARPFTRFITWGVWSGKRLFTPTNAGGSITNRFFAPVTEDPAFAPIIKAFPDIFVNGYGQTVKGKVMRGASYKDGREAIILDWRQVSGSGLGGIPLPNLQGLPVIDGMLVYDECRALQEGIWPCTANADLVHDAKKNYRKTFQFGWMMWQSNDPSVKNWEDWEDANPRWSKPAAYGFTS